MHPRTRYSIPTLFLWYKTWKFFSEIWKNKKIFGWKASDIWKSRIGVLIEIFANFKRQLHNSAFSTTNAGTDGNFSKKWIILFQVISIRFSSIIPINSSFLLSHVFHIEKEYIDVDLWHLVYGILHAFTINTQSTLDNENNLDDTMGVYMERPTIFFSIFFLFSQHSTYHRRCDRVRWRLYE